MIFTFQIEVDAASVAAVDTTVWLQYRENFPADSVQEAPQSGVASPPDTIISFLLRQQTEKLTKYSSSYHNYHC